MLRRTLLPLAVLLVATLAVWRLWPAEPTRTPPAAALAVEFAGCAEVRAGPVCAVGEGPLRLWAPGAEPPGIRIDDATIEARPTAAAGGWRIAVNPQAGSTRLVVEAGLARWTLALTPAPTPIRLDRTDSAARIEARLSTAGGAERARLLRASARLALRRGALDDAAAALTRAERAAGAAGLESEARLSAATRAHVFFMQRRIAEARAALSDARPPAPGDAYGAYVMGYAKAQIARGAGDLRAAVRELDAAARVAERVGLAKEARAARHEQGTLLGELGRVDDAVTVMTRLDGALPADADPCERGDLGTNLGWALIRSGQPARAARRIDGALALYEGCGHNAAFRRAIARVNLAVAHLESGDDRAAATALAEVGGDGGPEAAAWRVIVEGRLARRRGDLPAADAAFAGLDARAEAAGSTALRWRAAFERGLTAEAGCDWSRAAALYGRAEALLFDASVRIAADSGRTRFLADRGDSATHRVRALVALGRPAAAFDAARRARRRGLLGFSQHSRIAGLSAEARARWEAAYADYVAERAAFDAATAGDWDRSAHDLAALAPQRRVEQARLSAMLDGLTTITGRAPGAETPLRPFDADAPALGWFPAPSTPSACRDVAPAPGFAFAAIGGTVRAAPLVDPDAPLAPFAAALAEALPDARRVELLPAGALRDRDLHMTPLDGAPLGARVPVVWRLDGPPVPAADRVAGGALVVVDPRVDLARARSEGEAVAARLRGAGWSVDRLDGTTVTGAALKAGLARAELFHYAGHAANAGLDGWRSAFLLAEETLTVGDLLTLPSAPRWAVLAGCETGRASGEGSGIGLAHALLSVGSQAVVATARPVTDDDAAAFSAAFYGALPRGAGEAAAVYEAYRHALAAVPGAGRGAFRLLVP